MGIEVRDFHRDYEAGDPPQSLGRQLEIDAGGAYIARGSQRGSVTRFTTIEIGFDMPPSEAEGEAFLAKHAALIDRIVAGFEIRVDDSGPENRRWFLTDDAQAALDELEPLVEESTFAEAGQLTFEAWDGSGYTPMSDAIEECGPVEEWPRDEDGAVDVHAVAVSLGERFASAMGYSTVEVDFDYVERELQDGLDALELEDDDEDDN